MIAELELEVKPATYKEKKDYEPLCEIIDGERVELPPMSILASRINCLLMGLLFHHVYSQRLGSVLMETLFHLPIPGDRNRRPDIAFVSKKSLAEAPAQDGSENAWKALPELVVEVISPSNIAEEVLERVNEYFAAGTRMVWVVYPVQRLIYVYESPSEVRVLKETDELDGGTVVPGFRIPIATLFSLE